MHSIRKRLKLSTYSQPETNIGTKQIPKLTPSSCPSCGSIRLRKARLSTTNHNEYLCQECFIIFNPSNNGILSLKENKMALIKTACEDRKSLSLVYKGRTRTIYPYVCNEIYCVALCTYRKELRTFRIDRMKRVKVVESFPFDNSLYADAKIKIYNIKRSSY